MEGQEDDKIIVQSLIGGSQLPFYLRCLKSLVTFCQDRIDLQLHYGRLPLSRRQRFHPLRAGWNDGYHHRLL